MRGLWPRHGSGIGSVRRLVRVGTSGVAIATALGFVQFYHPSPALTRRPFAGELEDVVIPPAEPARSAFGRSGAVQVRFALPQEAVDYPLEVQGDPSQLAYEWVRLADSVPASRRRPLSSAALTAPSEPGFYELALVRGAVRRIVDGLAVSVMVPFATKRGPVLEGYRIGTFLAERGRGESELPAGFVRVTSELANVPITRHLRLGDFLTRVDQQQWPRYAAIDPRVLDKLELVMAEVARARGDSTGHLRVELNVHSGFRTPFYNRTLPRAARDSRHQYGEAIDVAIDADGDGELTVSDVKLVALAVERVEAAHPDLVGGMGVYTSRGYQQPFVHIDVRGTRARWRG